MTGQRSRAWLGLGGNLGDPMASMASALRSLDERSDTQVMAVSAVYRTPPWGNTDQEWFQNACAEVATTLDPEALLDACLEVERHMKRERIERWGPRNIDIDVLAYEGVSTLASPTLTLPHPRMTERAFVLVPLADIAPQLVIDGRNVAEWSELCDRTGIEKVDGETDWWRLR